LAPRVSDLGLWLFANQQYQNNNHSPPAAPPCTVKIVSLFLNVWNCNFKAVYLLKSGNSLAFWLHQNQCCWKLFKPVKEIDKEIVKELLKKLLLKNWYYC